MAVLNKQNSKNGCLIDRGSLRYVVPAIIFAIGILFVVIGVNDGEILSVFSKGIALCRECVGIG